MDVRFHTDAGEFLQAAGGFIAADPVRYSVFATMADRDRVIHGIADGRYHLWEVDGTPVHLTGVTPPTHGMVRLGPVYTPDRHRGRGYAAHVVATLAQRAVDARLRVCLFTDQANPVSNRVYQRIGFEPLGDQAEFRVI